MSEAICNGTVVKVQLLEPNEVEVGASSDLSAHTAAPPSALRARRAAPSDPHPTANHGRIFPIFLASPAVRDNVTARG